MLEFQVLAHPRYEMILERAFNDLMKKVGGDKFVYVGTREIIGKRLKSNGFRTSVIKFLIEFSQ